MQKASNIYLAMDTALGETSVALWAGGQVAACLHNGERDRQATMLVLWVEDVLRQAGYGYHDLTTIAACIGPGGFTGIRIGLATARALGFAANIPVVGYSTLRLMAYGAGGLEAARTAVLPAGREQVFFQRFGAGLVATEEPRLLLRTELAATLHPEETVVTTLSELPAGRRMAHDSASHATLMVTMLAAGIAPDAATAPAPLYIKLPDAKTQQPFLERFQSPQSP